MPFRGVSGNPDPRFFGTEEDLTLIVVVLTGDNFPKTQHMFVDKFRRHYGNTYFTKLPVRRDCAEYAPHAFMIINAQIRVLHIPNDTTRIKVEAARVEELNTSQYDISRDDPIQTELNSLCLSIDMHARHEGRLPTNRDAKKEKLNQYSLKLRIYLRNRGRPMQACG